MGQGLGENELRLLADERFGVRGKTMGIIKGFKAVRHGFERASEVSPSLQTSAVSGPKISGPSSSQCMSASTLAAQRSVWPDATLLGFYGIRSNRRRTPL